MTTWTLNPIYSYLTLLVIGLLMFGVLWIGPAFGNLTKRKKWILTAMRGGVFLFLLFCMLRPGLVTTERKPQTAILNLLIDLSRSMELSHRSDGASRFAAVKQMLQKHGSKMQLLKDANIDLKVFGFDRELIPLEVNGGRIELPGKVDGGQTDMGTSIDQSFKGSRSKRLIGSILLGDGVQNITVPDVDLQQAVRLFQDLQIPLFTIAFGQEGDAGQFADLAITNMPEQYSCNLKNELIVNATLETRGFVNREIPIQLVLTDASGESKTVQTVRKTITKEEQQIEVEFNYIPEVAGRYTLNVIAETQAQELVTKNNQLPAFLNVDEKGLRVLYLRGKEGAEQLYLKKSIGAAQGIDVDVVYIDPDSYTRWPLDRNDLFENSLYDVIIIHDLDASALHKKGDTRSSLSTLVKTIEKGKGFLMIGGNRSFGAGGYFETPLGEILPIEMGQFEKQVFDPKSNQRLSRLHVPGPIVVRPTRRHYLTTLFGNDNENGWAQLPPLSSVNRFLGIKDQARILLESTDKDPVLIQGNFGGRILLFAGDSTWKWWTSGNKEIHKRFWRQVILWLARRDGLGNDNIWVNLPQRRIEPETELKFTCEASSTLGERIRDANFNAILTSPDGNQTEINVANFENGSAGKIVGEFLSNPGNYLLNVSATQSDRDLGSTKVEFVVLDRDSEKANPVADPGRLTRMSNQTSEWGGRSVPPEEFGSLITEIIENREDDEIEIEKKWQLGDTWQDGLAVLALFTILLSTEWYLRKKWGLV